MKTRFSSATVIVLALLSLNLRAAVLYVDLNSTNAIAPYTNWATAAAYIQQALDACGPYDTILVTNGLYKAAKPPGLITWASSLIPTAHTTNVIIQSVNGPRFTAIEGGPLPQPVRGVVAVGCFYMFFPATLSGFTLTNGAPQETNSYDNTNYVVGGGVRCLFGGVVTNCVIVGCSAPAGGGGAAGGTLVNCTLIGNSTPRSGGGAGGCTLINCLVVSNSAAYGGGADYCNLYNCTVSGNSASVQGGGLNALVAGPQNQAPPPVLVANTIIFGNSAPANSNLSVSGTPLYMSYSCTAPLPPGGVGNITNDPAFMNPAGGDFHLGPNSPCINSGINANVGGATDLDGNPRIVGGTVDIGAYEYQSPLSVISYAWLDQFGLPTDGSADFTDDDGTGMDNYQKWIAGLDPTNSLSALAMLPPVVTNNPPGVVVSWQSVSDRTYFLQSSTNLGPAAAFSTIASGIPGQAGSTRYTDTNAVGAAPVFYRVGVSR